MTCKQCGNEININDQFCPVCGAVIDNQTMLVDDGVPSVQNPYSEPQPVQAQPVQAQPIQPQPVQAQPVQPQPVQPIQPAPMRPQYESSQPVQPQAVQPVQPQYTQPQPVQSQYAQTVYGQPIQPGVTPESEALSKGILGFGIAAIICAWFPIGSILGIIFGAIAKGRAKTFDANGYPSNGRRVTGKVLGIIGMVGGIVMTVYYTYIFFIAVALGASGI